MKKKNRIWCLIGLTLIIGIPSIVNGIESINYDREKKAVEQGLRQAEEILGYSVKDEFRYEYGNAEKVLATREAERGYKIIEIIEYDKEVVIRQAEFQAQLQAEDDEKNKWYISSYESKEKHKSPTCKYLLKFTSNPIEVDKSEVAYWRECRPVGGCK